MLKVFGPLFPRINECDNTQGTLYRGPQAIVTITKEFLIAFFQDLRDG